MARLGGVGFDLAAEPLDVGVEGPRISQIGVVPEMVDALISGDDLARMAHEELQEVELFSGEIDDGRINPELSAAEVEDERSDSEDLGVLAPFARFSAEHGTHARDELSEAVGLGHVVGGTEFKAEHDVDLFTLGRDHDDRDLAERAESLAQIGAVDVGEHDVEEHEINGRVAEDLFGFSAVSGGHDGEPFGVQADLQGFSVGALVVDDEDELLTVGEDHRIEGKAHWPPVRLRRCGPSDRTRLVRNARRCCERGREPFDRCAIARAASGGGASSTAESERTPSLHRNGIVTVTTPINLRSQGERLLSPLRFRGNPEVNVAVNGEGGVFWLALRQIRGGTMAEAPFGKGVKQRDIIKMTDEEIQTFIHERRNMTMCTLSPDGRIHAVGMWYGFIGGVLSVETKAKAQKVLNLRRNPTMTILIEDGEYYEELRGVEFVGTAEISEDPDELWELGVSVFSRYYGGYSDELKPFVEAMLNKRVAVKLHIDKVVSWDHRKLGMPSSRPAGA